MLTRKDICFFALLWAFPGLAFAAPSTTQPVEKNWEKCSEAVRAAESGAGIPKHLLSAISRAESGRWHPKKGANFAWPWTVTAHGKGRFFDTKLEAIAEAEILLTQGVRNIDVGCMQINLMYHDQAFETLDQAFDPAANAAYGAKYLRAMHDKTKDWRKAAAHYHSTTPEQAARYRAKVLRLWDEARNPNARPKPAIETASAAPEAKEAPAATNDPVRPSAINYGLMHRLNSAFQERREQTAGEQIADRAARQAHLRREQLETWRENKVAGLSLVHLANMRRAELAQRRNKELHRVSAQERSDDFTERRRKELELWRKRRTDPHFYAYPEVRQN